MKLPFAGVAQHGAEVLLSVTKQLNAFPQCAAEHTWTVECNIADMREVILQHIIQSSGVDLILQGSDIKNQNYSTNI